MSPDLLVHAGTPKTGTSTIQRFLSANAGRLLCRGVLFPSAGRRYGGHHAIARHYRDAEDHWIERVDRRALFDQLHREEDAEKPRETLLSSEAFWGLSRGAEFARDFAGRKIRVVIYLRRQDHFLESRYAFHKKMGVAPEPPEEYRKKYARSVNYREKLDAWASVVGRENVIVAPFERRQLNGGIEGPIFDALSIGQREFFKPARSFNVRLDRSSLLFLQMLADIQGDDGVRTGWRRAARAALEARAAKMGKRPREFLLPASIRGALVEEAAEMNAAIARDFLGREDGVLFLDPPPEIPGSEPDALSLSREEIAELACYLARWFVERGDATDGDLAGGREQKEEALATLNELQAAKEAL